MECGGSCLQEELLVNLAVALTIDLAVGLAADREYRGLSHAGLGVIRGKTTTAHTIS